MSECTGFDIYYHDVFRRMILIKTWETSLLQHLGRECQVAERYKNTSIFLCWSVLLLGTKAFVSTVSLLTCWKASVWPFSYWIVGIGIVRCRLGYFFLCLYGRPVTFSRPIYLIVFYFDFQFENEEVKLNSSSLFLIIILLFKSLLHCLLFVWMRIGLVFRALNSISSHFA